MSFTTENRTVNDLFHRNVRYIIPRYQREYVWTEVNWNELLMDVQFTIENDKSDWSHFLGTIVLNRLDKNNTSNRAIEPLTGVEDYEIIDGQQRLTTLYVIFICIVDLMYNYVMKNGETEDILSIARKRAETFEEMSLSSKTNLGSVIAKLYNPDYNLALQELLTHIHHPTVDLRKNKFKKLYGYLKSYFESYSYTVLDQFLSKTMDINIVEIISDKDEEIYNIFEVLNARGQKLKQMELLKNHILKYVTPRDHEYIDMARQKWTNILENLRSLSNEDEFIDHFSKCYIKKSSLNASSTYRLIKEEIPIKKIRSFLDDMLYFSEHYKKVIQKPNDNEYIQYFHIKNNKQIRPLLTAIFLLMDKEIIEPQVASESMKYLRNYFFIFNVTKQTSNKLEDIMRSAAYSIYHVKYYKEYQIEISRLFYALNNYLPVSKEVFSENLFTNPSLKYSNKDSTIKRNGQLVKYFFTELYKAQQIDTRLDYRDLTIEHLLNDDGDTEHAKIHNLTVTAASINSDQLQNKPISEKLSILESDSTIQANKDLLKYYGSGESDFNSEMRKEDLLDLIYDNVFSFSPDSFGVTIDDIKKYDSIYNKVNDTETLADMLKRYGLGFEKVIDNDPKCAEMKDIYTALDNK